MGEIEFEIGCHLAERQDRLAIGYQIEFDGGGRAVKIDTEQAAQPGAMGDETAAMMLEAQARGALMFARIKQFEIRAMVVGIEVQPPQV